MGGTGCTAQGRAGGGDPPRSGLSLSLAGTQGSRGHRAQAGSAPERRVSRTARHETQYQPAAHDPAKCLQRFEGRGLALAADPFARGAAAVLGRRHCGGERSLRPVRRHSQSTAGGRQMSDLSANLSILGPALIAGLLVALSHVPMGQQVLARGIVFIDLAIAQVAGLGVIAAHNFGLGAESNWSTQVSAAVAALLGALLLTWTERKRPEVQEALIGVLFVLASTAQILILANNPHGGEDLRDLLAGQILWVSTEQLVRTAVVTAVSVAVWFLWRERFGRLGLYVLF